MKLGVSEPPGAADHDRRDPPACACDSASDDASLGAFRNDARIDLAVGPHTGTQDFFLLIVQQFGALGL